MFRASDIARSKAPGDRVRRLRTGSYLTDWKRLFRCVLAERGSLLIFEDCRTLDFPIMRFEDLAAMRLRVIKVPA